MKTRIPQYVSLTFSEAVKIEHKETQDGKIEIFCGKMKVICEDTEKSVDLAMDKLRVKIYQAAA